MKKRLLLAVLVAAVAALAWCFHKRLFGDDEARIREVIHEMETAAEAKNVPAIMEHFSRDYKDDSGNNKFIINQLVKRSLAGVDEFQVEIKDVDVMVAGERAWTTVTIVSQATRRGKIISPFGTEQDPEQPRVTFERTATGDWLIIKVEGVDSPGF